MLLFFRGFVVNPNVSHKVWVEKMDGVVHHIAVHSPGPVSLIP